MIAIRMRVFPLFRNGSLDDAVTFGYARVDKRHNAETMAMAAPSPLDPVIRLTVSEAAKMFGVSPRTVRRAILEKEVTYIVVQGRYKINFESLLRWSQSSTTVRNKRDRKGIGRFVEIWKIKNTLYSPNPELLKERETPKEE